MFNTTLFDLIVLFLLSFYSVQDSARKIARVAIEAKLDLDEEEYVESFRPHLMDVVHAWCSVSQLIYLYTYPFIHLSIYPSIYLSI